MTRAFLPILLPFLLLVGCSHMNPHFWPDSFHVPQKTAQKEKSNNYWRAPANVELVTDEPSLARSQWKLLEKSTDSQRTYLLVIKDREGKIIDTENPPEILLQGEALLNQVTKSGKGKWKVVLDFPSDQSVVSVGFAIGEYRIERFRRLHWQSHQVDRMMSDAFANKIRIRSDGKDSARVFVHLRDTQNFPIYQFHDFELKIKVLSGKAKIKGPFSTLSGPYFVVRGTDPGKIKVEATIDGQTFGKPFEIELIKNSGRLPASNVNECINGLASKLKRETNPQASIEEEYEKFGEMLVDSFQLLITPSEMQLEENLNALSSPACTAIAQLDDLRESFSQQLRKIALKAHRTAQSKGNPHNMWNPQRPQ